MRWRILLVPPMRERTTVTRLCRALIIQVNEMLTIFRVSMSPLCEQIGATAATVRGRAVKTLRTNRRRRQHLSNAAEMGVLAGTYLVVMVTCAERSVKHVSHA